MKIQIVAVALATIFTLVGCKEETAQKEVVKAITDIEMGNQTVCPVMGGKIDKNQFVDVKGYRIYVCCAGCQEKILADPVKYVSQLQEQGVTLATTPQK